MHLPRIKSIDFLVLAAVLIFGVHSADVALLSSEMHHSCLASIDYIYKEKFSRAEQEARKVIKKFPDHPAGYFFYAAAIYSWMVYYETDKREDEFYQYCDLAIEKGEAILAKDRDNVWAKFFVGGADGYKGTYESRFERWITAFRYGWKGVSVLLDLHKKHPEIKDIAYGIGSYNYWRSALIKKLWWMPGVVDKRESGITMLYEAKKDGIYTRLSATESLVAVLNNEKRYREAIKVANEMLKKYPNSLVFHWGMAKALYGNRQYKEAEKAFRYILGRVEAESFDNHYNASRCHLWLAKIHFSLQQYTQCVAECNRMKHYQFDSKVEKRLEPQFSEAEEIKKQALAARLKSPQPTFVP
ncbi:MAG: tetratricopeptide repeat protein [Chitinivibrionales bacterium]|nr:tetratricopeptide repeat protein [Chitinivibrionales bacterium]